MPRKYSILDNGQDSEQRRRNADRGRSAKKTMRTASANAGTERSRRIKAEVRKYGRKGTGWATLDASERRGMEYEEHPRTASVRGYYKQSDKQANKPQDRVDRMHRSRASSPQIQSKKTMYAATQRRLKKKKKK